MRARAVLASIGFAISSVCGAATWTYQETSSTVRGSLFIDADSVRNIGPTTIGWTKIEWPIDTEFRGSMVRYVVAEWSAHCMERRITVGQALAHRANGSVIARWPEATASRSVPPDSYEEAIYKGLCRTNEWRDAQVVTPITTVKPK